ncbi:MAG: terpene utilization protein AtuA, partial [Proteobacteria bacterium]|nr:terpene utilization protein AtuA [Pseudomonadota bacterium]
RQRPAPVVKLFSFLVPKTEVTVRVRCGAVDEPWSPTPGRAAAPAVSPARHPAFDVPTGPALTLPLVSLAWARSGDKGNTGNIGVIARHADFLPLIAHGVSAERVAAHFSYCVEGPVTRHDVPGIGGWNFVLERALDGGGMASMRADPLGKGFAQMLLDLPLEVPVALAAKHGLEPEA